jgi:hypothetical protein
MIEYLKLANSFFAGLLCSWLRQENFGVSPNMPHFPSLPQTNPLAQKQKFSTFQYSGRYGLCFSEHENRNFKKYFSGYSKNIRRAGLKPPAGVDYIRIGLEQYLEDGFFDL